MPAGLRRVEQVMGTAVSLHLAGPIDTAAASPLADRVFDWLREVDRRFSTYRPDSEVNRLDRGEINYSQCSRDLREVLDTCADLWRTTDGWFDPHATGRLDPSGYVKGWAVEVASRRLREQGAADHCINAGGDVRVCGTPTPLDGSAAKPWRIGIRHPWQPDRVCWVLTGTDLAVATSGSYERGRHVVDPFQREPAHGLCSVTVVAEDLGLADGYATAALAMGRRGIDWLASLPRLGWAAVTDEGDAYRSEALPVLEATQWTV